MAKPTTRTVALAVRRNLLPFSVAALGAALLSAFMVSNALAQKAPGGGDGGGGGGNANDLIFDAIEFCAEISEDSLDGEEQLIAAGWTIDYSDSNGPYVWEISATKLYPSGAEASIFALIESYPTGEITYCSFDAFDSPEAPDLAIVAQEYDVIGETQDMGGGLIYGTWEVVEGDTTYYVLANTDIDYFFLQMTAVTTGLPPLGDGDAPAGSGK